MPKHRFEVLDGMRGVAALIVMVYHFFINAGHPIMMNANAAVDFFFILSGFVVAYSYGERLLSGSLSARDYIVRRIIRLYPMVLMGLLIGTPVLLYLSAYGHSNYTSGDIISSLSYNLFVLPFLNLDSQTPIINASAGVIFPVNAPLWSIFFEIFASIVFLSLVRLKNSMLIKLIAVSFVVILFQAAVAAYQAHTLSLPTGVGWSTTNFIGGFPRVIYGFCFGMLLCRVFLSDTWRTNALVRIYDKIPFRVAGIFLFLLLVLIFPKSIHGLYFFFVSGFLAPLVVFAGAITPCRTEISLNSARFLGWISFPVYCLHVPIGHAVDLMFESQTWPQIVPFFSQYVAMLATVIVSVVIVKVYDEPVRIFAAHWFANHSSSSINGSVVLKM